MKKTFTANIGGWVFHVDEDAYDKLSHYLDHIRQNLSSEDGREEILEDIESRIAEMFQEKLTPSKKVITLADVQDVITQLGEPEQFESDDSAGSKKSSHTTEKTHKRLYRDPDDQYIAGVAGGLGAFFNLDPTWVRVAFVIFTFFYAFGPLLYIILWVVVPKATTTAEKLEMRGEKVNLSNIEKSIREELNSIKENIKEFSQETQEHFKKKKKKKSSENKDSSYNALLRALAIAAGILLIVMSFGILATVISSIYWLPVSISASYGIIHLSIHEFLTVFLTSPLHIKLAMTGILLILLIPVFWIIMMAIQLIFGLKNRLRFLGPITFFFWLCGMALIVFVLIVGVRNFTNHYSYTETHNLQVTEGQNFQVQVNSEKFELYDMRREASKLAGWKLRWQHSETTAAGVPGLRVTSTAQETPTLKITRQARGNSDFQAAENAEKITYAFQQKDSVLYIDPAFYYNKDQGWRNQKVSLELQIPTNSSVAVDHRLRQVMPVHVSPSVKKIAE